MSETRQKAYYANILRIEGHTRELAKDQPEYTNLCIRDDKLQGLNFMTSSWELHQNAVTCLIKRCGIIAVSSGSKILVAERPSQKDIKTLAEGGTICVSLEGTTHPPVLVYVTEPEFLMDEERMKQWVKISCPIQCGFITYYSAPATL